MKKRGGYHRASRTFRRKSKKTEEMRLGKWLVLAVVCSFVFGLRSAEEGPLFSLREGISEMVRQVFDIDKTIETLGNRFAVGTPDDENAILVFGRMILGLEEDEASSDAEDEISDDDAKSSLDHAESAVPIFNTAQLAEELSAAEIDDSTSNIPFVIPSPDIVDDTVYTPEENFCLPLQGYRVTSRFGYRIHPISGNTTFHYGADLAAATGTKVVSIGDGKVKETGYGSINGKFVKIDHADGYTSHYTHLHEIGVEKGQDITCGQKIGTVGSTGYSTGPHLHFELRHDGKVLDPFAYFRF